MPEYIERETVKAKKVYCEERHEFVVPVSEIDWIPTADVQEVRRGEWEQSDFDVVCSRCGYIESAPRPFCSECGAKMDEE